MVRQCVDCANVSPEAETPYTLIGRCGWRTSVRLADDGSSIVEWRCPPCWQVRKTASVAALRVSEPKG